MAIPSAPTTSSFLEFDRKTGFQVGARPAPLPTEAPQRLLRLSLFEAAFGCTKRMASMEALNCPLCAGRGQLHAAACPTCLGRGKTERRTWEQDVTVHAGTLDGAEVSAGDVRVVSNVHGTAPRVGFRVLVEKHPLFRLDKDRLSITVPISVWAWVQGGDITVPTLTGSARVRLPHRPGAIAVPNQGWPEPGTPQRRKPLYVLPRIVFPEHLRHEERRMLELLEVRSDMPEVKSWARHLRAWVESPSTDFE